MALIVKDRVQELSTTVGTGTLTLGGATLGFQSFAAIGDGNTTYYAINDPITGDWEAGIGTYTSSGTTLSRDTVLSSSNGGSLVSFVAGSKNVFCTYPSERAVYLDSAGSYPVQNTFNTLNATTAVLTAGTISTTPSAATDIVNKSYVDTLAASGIHFHQPVRVESPINLNATYNNGTAGVGATLTNSGTQVALVIDGITMVVADRVLVYEQTTQTQNGIYVVTSVGSGSTNWVLTRASDADTYVINSANGLSEGSTVFVQQGATGAGETYTCNTSGVITFGTTNITFAQISSAQIYSAGTGLTLSGTTFSITDTGTAGTYGGANSVPVITTNAQGQVTSVSPTTIAISSAAVSGLAASATTDTTNASNISSGTLGTSRLSGSYTGITGVGALAAGSLASGFTAVTAPLGGTGQTSYAVGDLLYADTTTSLAKLADVAVGSALISGGVAAAPSYGKIGLATHVSGTLPEANGGTGITSFGTGIATFLGTPSSTNLAAAVTDETGSGSLVFATSPTLVTPALGTPSSGTLTNCTFPTLNQSTTGNAATATALQTARNINEVSFNGSANITVPRVRAIDDRTTAPADGTTAYATFGFGSWNNNNTSPYSDFWLLRSYTDGTGGNDNMVAFRKDALGMRVWQQAYGSATAFASFKDVAWTDGTNASGTWGINIAGNANTATTLLTARTIGGVSFNGSANINLPGVNIAGNQNTTGSAATVTGNATGSTFGFNSGYGSVATAYGCRAWVNFDGTANSNLTGTYTRTSPSTTVTVTITAHGLTTGNRVYLDFTSGTGVDGEYIATVTGLNTFTVTTVASTTTSGNVTLRQNTIRASGNVSSVADTGTGLYAVNFATAMPDANYAVTATSAMNIGSTDASVVVVDNFAGAQTAGAVQLFLEDVDAGGVDSPIVMVVIHR
jgi:hypothetical protein